MEAVHLGDYEVIKREPEILQFRVLNMFRFGLRITTDEGRWFQAKLDTGREFFNSLTDEQAKRICFQECEPPAFGDWMIGEWFLRTPSDKASEWYEGFKSRQKKERIESIPTMINEELAAFLREYPDCVKATAEALARILTGENK